MKLLLAKALYHIFIYLLLNKYFCGGGGLHWWWVNCSWHMLINEPNELLGYHVGLQQTVGANEQLAMVSYEIHSQQLSIKDTLCI